MFDQMKQDAESPLGMFQLALRSSNYVNTPHLDNNDAVSSAVSNVTLQKWQTTLDSGCLFFPEEARLAKAADFAKEHGLGVHTAVTYQFVKTAAGLQETSCETVVYQVCFFSSIGLAKRIQNFETHLFMARVLPHATCVPVFVKGNMVSFGHHDDVTVEAWGKAMSNS